MSDNKLREIAVARLGSEPPPSDAAPVAEPTEVIATNVMRLLDVDGSPTTDLLNLLAGYGIRCEQDGTGDAQLGLKLETMEFKNGLISDRRKAATPEDAPGGPGEELEKAATLYISALKRLIDGYRGNDGWKRIMAIRDSVDVQEDRWRKALDRLKGEGKTDG